MNNNHSNPNLGQQLIAHRIDEALQSLLRKQMVIFLDNISIGYSEMFQPEIDFVHYLIIMIL